MGQPPPRGPSPGHGHALYLQGEVMLHQGWGRCTTLGCAKLWAGRRWGVSQVLLPPALVRLTQGPAMWTNLMLLGRVRLGRQQVEGGWALKGLGIPVSRLAVPSPGEEIGQRLEHSLPVQMGKHKS